MSALRTLRPAVPALLLGLGACARYAPEPRTELRSGLPARFSLYSEEPADAQTRWWEGFGSAELDALVAEALASSPSIAQAWARLDQADATARKAGAARYPFLGYEGAARAARNSETRTTTEAYSLGLNASYELDLWGRVRSQAEAARLDREATREQVNTVALTLASQVALRWSGIVAQRLQTEVIRRQLEANRTSLELIELRFRNALSTALDVYQQRQAVSATEARLPLAELREELLRNELAALLGRADPHALAIEETALPDLGAPPPTGIPADTLANRPDVRQAGLRLQAADWAVSAARADRLPALRLAAEAEYRGGDLADLFDNWYANLAASLAGPVFEGGRRRAEVERARAAADERLAAYREAVATAVREVEDALVSEQKQRDYIDRLDQRLEAARIAHGESINRYRNGLVEYTTVLIQLDALQSLERERVEAQAALLQYRINLHRALGGTWPNERPRT